MKTFAVIVNPNAGRKLGLDRFESLREIIMEKEKCEFHVHETIGKEDTIEAATRFGTGNYDLIMVFGGDGTTNEVVNGLMKTQSSPPLALFPMGTANDVATHLKIPRNLKAYAEMILDPQIIPVDVGKAGDRYFLNVAAGGLLPDLAHKVSSEKKSMLGKFAYYLEGFIEFPKQFFQTIEIELELEGRVETRDTLFFLLANGPIVGGFKNLVPKASLDDGKLDLLIVENTEFPDMANAFLSFLRKKTTPRKGVVYYRVDSFRLNSKKAVDVDVDGELCGHLPMTFKVIPYALQLIAPKNYQRQHNGEG